MSRVKETTEIKFATSNLRQIIEYLLDKGVHPDRIEEVVGMVLEQARMGAAS